MDWIEHPDFDALVIATAGELERICREALDERARAVLALAGGSTPLPVYRRLAEASLDWPRITLLPGDERWVAATDPASNLKAIRAAFGERPADFCALVPDHPAADPDLAAARAALGRTGGRFDACVLGMGADAHFASLFPEAPGLVDALDPGSDQALAVIHPDPLPSEAPYPRITLTLAAIARSRRILLLLRGNAKRQALQAALERGDPRRYPISALLSRQKLPLEIHWSP